MRRSHEVRVWNTFLPAVILGPVVSVLTVILSQVFSYLCWIGWIVVACGIQDNRCFE